MSTVDPQRRRGDSRPPRLQPFGPTPGVFGASDPALVLRSLELAFESAQRMRRPMTIVSIEVPPPPSEEVLGQAASLVRRTVRDTDGLWRDGARAMILLLTDADGPNSEPALARLRLRLRADGFDRLLMGRAARAPGLAVADLLDLAREDRRPIGYRGA